MPYHRFVFNQATGQFVGKFEEMYNQENSEGFDSWFQEDLRSIQKQLSLFLLGQYNFQRVLDLGCGKGTFTHLLKRVNNYVLGIDISKTAIGKARSKYPDIDFQVGKLTDFTTSDEPFELVVAMEVLSYLDDWRETLSEISRSTDYLYITLYLPNNPIGFVKSFRQLRTEIQRYFVIETELVQDSEHIYILARARTK